MHHHFRNDHRVPRAGPGSGPRFYRGGPTGLWLTEWEAGQIGNAPACDLGFSASFASHTLTLNFKLGTTAPAMFYVSLTASMGTVNQLWSKAIPATVPPNPVTLRLGLIFLIWAR